MNLQEWLGTEEEKPLDRMVTDGGLCGILRSIGCIGDSLSSGEFETYDDDGKKVYLDRYEYSWGQFIARAAGVKVHNFSRGGMTAKAYCDYFAEEKGFWSKDLACNAYILALGANDCHQIALGSVADINDADPKQNAETFAGYYARIIAQYKEISPNARFFLMSQPVCESYDYLKPGWGEQHQALLYDLAAHFSNCYVIDLRKYAPVYDAAFREKFFLRGHLNAAGYALTAQMVMSYIDYIIRHNLADFHEIGLVDTPYYGKDKKEEAK